MNFRFSPSVIFFGIPMGLLGSVLNGRHLETMFDTHIFYVDWLLWYGWLALAIVGGGYLFGFFTPSRHKLKAEWLNTFQISLFPSITLSLILGIVTLYETFTLSETQQAWLYTVYFLVVLFHTFLNGLLINRWIFEPSVPIQDHKPTWFILLSGNFVVVISGLTLFDAEQLAAWPVWNELLWFYFSAGLLIWFSFAVSQFYRLFFEPSLEPALRPSLFIFLAPPSLATIASLLLIHPDLAHSLPQENELPMLTWMLYSFAIFMFILLMVSAKHFISCGLTTTGWAYVYPLAAFGFATQYMAQILNSPVLSFASIVIFFLVTLFITLLSGLLLKHIIKS
ncbi:hypothetical protein QCB45_01235 [Thiomicrorhabdus sp. ZW0627]|uniref:SLAC1 family transporter n=1 Tax=Thiomicrorhabdus sp. ZW0627 TaxID=3039774 RepID=UPI0024363F01|nr:hypothetical protein [Thiomicrorhabdus sp. ZW0627]MDG6772937.1 hypothetical protein [Thiomicrorhabdus sp. ZW0627]